MDVVTPVPLRAVARFPAEELIARVAVCVSTAVGLKERLTVQL